MNILLFVGAFFTAFLLFPFYIKLSKSRQLKQSIRTEGPKSHQKKSGTPTMGGLVFIGVTTLFALLFLPHTPELWVLVMLTAGFGFVGFLDDFLKIRNKRNLGLTAKQKLAGQLLVSLASYAILMWMGLSTWLTIPGTHIAFDLSWAYLLFFLVFAIGTTNATNLTDGLDGLLGGLGIISVITYTVLAAIIGNTTAAMFSLILLGTLLAYVWFNQNPAKIFMGDTGSLAIGGYLVAVSILTKTELLLLITGGMYVFETATVIIQVAVYKWKKIRVFKMTPIHHSFELSGWNEWQTVFFFWFSGAILSILGVLLYLMSGTM